MSLAFILSPFYIGHIHYYDWVYVSWRFHQCHNRKVNELYMPLRKKFEYSILLVVECNELSKMKNGEVTLFMNYIFVYLHYLSHCSCFSSSLKTTRRKIKHCLPNNNNTSYLMWLQRYFRHPV